MQESQEVGRVVRAQRVATNSGIIGVLPAGKSANLDIMPRKSGSFVMNVLKVNTVEIVLGREVHNGLDKSSAVLRRADVGREGAGTSPATDGEHSLD